MINDELINRLEHLTEIGIALSAESNAVRLLEKILTSAKLLTNADGGTLYSIGNDGAKMEILRNDSLGISLGGTSGNPIPFPPIPLYKEDGTPNLNNVVTFAVHQNATVNIEDSYNTRNFDFSGTRKFDSETGYRSTSFLTIPLRNHENEIIGVLQLLNAMDRGSGAIVPFDPVSQRLTEALASQAGVALTKEQLIEDLKNLFQSLVRLIAEAIDQKSPYTGAHCRRVPAITMLLAEAVHDCEEGIFSDFRMTEQDRYELELAGWLHDCGKITTPEYVIDKATKLETIFDRIHLVDTRFEVLRRDAEIAWLRRRLQAAETGERIPGEAEAEYRREVQRIEADRRFLYICNKGGEFMNAEDQARVRQIGERSWELQGEPRPFLSENEIYNLNISRGTITSEEREIINNHIVVTIEMLHALPFPKSLKNVPEYAGGHHERMDGKGYPRGLTREQLSVQARIMGIADIFEALTAKDRPYKPGRTLSEALAIMARMKAQGHIDPDLFDIFVAKKVYLKYARQFLDEEQIDEVDHAKILGERLSG
jgi:HD-GYP domain-containing protein (c-di-GMP phosphodiesterase class II)